MTEDRKEFFGGYFQLSEDSMCVELGLLAGPRYTSTGFVAETDGAVVRSRSYAGLLSTVRAQQTVGLRMDRQVWDALLAAATEDQTAKCMHTVAELRRERDEAKRSTADLSRRLREALDQRAVWKESFEKTDTDIVQPLRRELRDEREKNAALIAEKRAARAAAGRPGAVTWHTVGASGRASITPDTAYVDELHDVIVSQAREIARLKGEIE